MDRPIMGGFVLEQMTREQIEQFYQSGICKRKRAMILRRDGYMCQLSKRYGKRVEAEVVHHIFPLEAYPEYALCNWNLIALSKAAHNKLHDRITNELTDEGKKLLRGVAIKRGFVLH